MSYAGEFLKPYKCFDLAIQRIEADFFQAFNDSGAERNVDLLLSLPWATLAAFQSELALKHLIETSGRKAPKVHNLAKLFGLLPAALKKEIQNEIEGHDFDLELTNVANLFVSSRYLSEAKYRPAFLRYFKDVLGSKLELAGQSLLALHRREDGHWRKLDV